jgi:hypothetical protein
MAKSVKVLIKNNCKNVIRRNAIIGDISIPILSVKGTILLIGTSIGSVVL